ncbi:glycyl radical enzyme [Clostridia bacterium]|nr:glycyl radical enzyme [Clostridia bacterium]
MPGITSTIIMTSRIRDLRASSLAAQPRVCMERAIIETEVYRQYEGSLSIPELRSAALLQYMSKRTLTIAPGELIVGEKASGMQAAPTFPELCCHTPDDMRIMNDRDLISFRVSKEDMEVQEREIQPFWERRSMRGRLFAAMSEEWKDCYNAGIFTEFMEQRGPGHTVGSNKIYEKGFLDYQRDIDAALAAIDLLTDSRAVQKAEELRAMRVACDAVITLGKRYAELARSMASVEQDPIRKLELGQIAQNCEVVPAHRPQTYWQAIQMYWFVHLCVTTELNPWDAYSPGRLDQHLYPFYQRDSADGSLGDEQALELLQCLWIKFNNQPAPPKVGITLKESGTYTDFANINTGGIAPDGGDGVNEVSYLILECMDSMRLLQPSSNVQISRKTPRRFLRRACEISRKGWGQPAFYNTEAIVQELIRAGKRIEDARLGGTSGCVETGAFGSEAYILTGYFNIPKILEITLHQGVDPRTGKQLGLRTAEAASFRTFDELYGAFESQMKHFIDIKIKGSNTIESLYAAYMPAPFLSVLTNDCIAKGMDYNAGGARYNTSYIQGVGIGTITDSLAAMQQLIFEDKSVTMTELLHALDEDFVGYERLLAMVTNRTPRYGNDDERADQLMRRVFESYFNIVSGRPNMRGGTYQINMLPTTCHVYFGEVTQATPNGRHAGKPLSEGISPTQGADVQGPSAMIRSAAKMDHLRTGGTLLNMKFSPSALSGEAGLDRMSDLVRTYFDLDGHHIQFNVIDRQTLIDAQNHPDEYRDLIVRVAGYSDHFRNLSHELQDEIINRTEHASFG